MLYWMVDFNWIALWSFLLFSGLLLLFVGSFIGDYTKESNNDKFQFAADSFIVIGGTSVGVAVIGFLIWMAIYSFDLMFN